MYRSTTRSNFKFHNIPKKTAKTDFSGVVFLGFAPVIFQNAVLVDFDATALRG